MQLLRNLVRNLELQRLGRDRKWIMEIRESLGEWKGKEK